MRQDWGRRTGPPPGRSLADEHPSVDQSPNDFFEEKGIAVGGGHQITPKRFRKCAPFEDLVQQCRTLLRCQSAERNDSDRLATLTEFGVGLAQLGPSGSYE